MSKNQIYMALVVIGTLVKLYSGGDPRSYAEQEEARLVKAEWNETLLPQLQTVAQLCAEYDALAEDTPEARHVELLRKLVPELKKGIEQIRRTTLNSRDMRYVRDRMVEWLERAETHYRTVGRMLTKKAGATLAEVERTANESMAAAKRFSEERALILKKHHLIAEK